MLVTATFNVNLNLLGSTEGLQLAASLFVNGSHLTHKPLRDCKQQFFSCSFRSGTKVTCSHFFIPTISDSLFSGFSLVVLLLLLCVLCSSADGRSSYVVKDIG